MWDENFNDSPNWTDLYFEKAFSQDSALVIEHENRPVSCLSLFHYDFRYSGRMLKAGYVSGACTSPRHRRAGNMTALMGRALRFAYDRGDAFMCLIPANRNLFYFYDRFGFASVFYIREMRYTSLHNFKPSGINKLSTEQDTEKLYDYYHAKELEMDGRVMHSRKDFNNIVWDNQCDGGKLLSVENNGVITAFAATVPSAAEVVVKELMADDGCAEADILDAIKSVYPGKDIVVEGRAVGSEKPIEARGMLRIVDARKVLETLAAANPSVKVSLKITDPLIEENNRLYSIENGKVKVDAAQNVNPDDELDIKTLAEVLFSTSAIGDLFNLPARRPSMALMLE